MCALVLSGASAGWAESWTLDALVAEGLKNSPDIKVVTEEQNKAEAQVKSTKASAAPVVTASANASHAFDSYSPTTSATSSLPPAMAGLADAFKAKDNSLNACFHRARLPSACVWHPSTAANCSARAKRRR